MPAIKSSAGKAERVLNEAACQEWLFTTLVSGTNV